MPDTEHEDPDTGELAAIIKEALAKSRGYAPYWEWAADPKVAEVGTANQLAEYLIHLDGREWASIRPVTDDPPDALLISSSGHRVGVEVTEIVDAATVARHRYRKKHGAAEPYDFAEWSVDKLTAVVVQAVERKDQKLAARSGDYDELIVALITDEFMITHDLAQQALSKSAAQVATIDRAFLMLSYNPQADREAFPQGIVFLPVPLIRP